MNLLHDVVSFPGSKMSAGNLSAIFTPNILRPLDEDEKTMKRASVTTELELANHQHSVGVVELLITNFREIGRVPVEITRMAKDMDAIEATAIILKLRQDPPKKGGL